MKMFKTMIGGELLPMGGLVFSVNFGEKPDRPKLPDVEWVVHEGTRPQARKVETRGAVEVQAPADAGEYFGPTAHKQLAIYSA